MAAIQSTSEEHPPQLSSRSFLDVLAGPSSVNLHSCQPTTYRGFPSVAFSAEDISRFAAPFRFALIGKFSNGRPPMESIRKSFVSIGFAGSHTQGLIDHRHILINFQQEEDYVRAFLKRFYSIDGFIMRLFKWSPQFSVESESAILPIWINFPLLPLHLFNKEALYSIARLIGEPLKLDASTSTRSRPSVARVCVEIDLRKNRPEKVWIVNGDAGFWQPVDYENIPPVCTHCYKIGHQPEVCRSVAPSVVGVSVKRTSLPKARFEYRPKTVHEKLPINVADHDLDAGGLKLQDEVPSVSQKCGTVGAEKQIAAESSAASDSAEASGLQKSSTLGEISARTTPISSLVKPNSFGTQGADAAAEASIPCNSISGETLPEPFTIIDEIPPDLVAVCQANESAPPQASSCRMVFDEIQRSEVVVQDSPHVPMTAAIDSATFVQHAEAVDLITPTTAAAVPSSDSLLTSTEIGIIFSDDANVAIPKLAISEIVVLDSEPMLVNSEYVSSGSIDYLFPKTSTSTIVSLTSTQEPLTHGLLESDTAYQRADSMALPRLQDAFPNLDESSASISTVLLAQTNADSCPVQSPSDDIAAGASCLADDILISNLVELCAQPLTIDVPAIPMLECLSPALSLKLPVTGLVANSLA